MSVDAPRNFSGYGRRPPDPRWPGGARIAVQIVLNYEEGGERCLLDGDAASETHLTDVPGARAIEGGRDLSVESSFEYGSRAGFWRLHRLLTARRVPVTVFGVTTALARNPEAVAAMSEAGWEIACHGYRWLDYGRVTEDEERAHLRAAIELHARITGSRPRGWYTGRTSASTRQLVVEEGGFAYDADSYADDLPYWVRDHGRPHLVVPYTLDQNDMRLSTLPGFGTGRELYEHLVDAFDTLYDEGQSAPKMMSVGLHGRLAGRPGRAGWVARFLDHLASKDHVWLCRRIEIAEHWMASHSP